MQTSAGHVADLALRLFGHSPLENTEGGAAKVVAQNDLTVPPFNIWGRGVQYFLIGGQRVQKKEDILIHLVSP